MTLAISLTNIGRSVRLHAWSRPRPLLKQVNFSLAAGEMCALLGANGAGKTTLLRVLLGLARAQAGHGELFGHAIGTPLSRRSLGFLPERPCLAGTSTPLESVTLAARLSGLAGLAAHHAAAAALARLGIEKHAKARMQHFSKGMLQRVGLAQAIVHAPRLLLLDEPLSGLDPPARHDVRRLLAEERERGASILFATHLLSDVVQSCDRAAVLVAGELVHHASPAALMAVAEARAQTKGGHTVVELSFGEVAPKTLAEVRALATQVASFGTQWRVRVDGVERANRVVDLVRAAGATLFSLEHDARALEVLLTAGPDAHAPTAPSP